MSKERKTNYAEKNSTAIKPHIRHDLDRPARVQIFPKGESATKQSFKDECDINNIMAAFAVTGVLNHANESEANYGFASSDSSTESMHLITDAQNMFANLPSQLRTRFDNDPVKFLEFTENANNLPEMIELGLMADDYVPPSIETTNTPPAKPVLSTTNEPNPPTAPAE